MFGVEYRNDIPKTNNGPYFVTLITVIARVVTVKLSAQGRMYLYPLGMGGEVSRIEQINSAGADRAANTSYKDDSPSYLVERHQTKFK
jgi:hypothetical protein